MPDQAMAGDSQVVVRAKLHKLVGIAEVVTTLFFKEFTAFHAVFGYNGIEVFLNDTDCGRVFSGGLTRVQCYANQEFVL